MDSNRPIRIAIRVLVPDRDAAAAAAQAAQKAQLDRMSRQMESFYQLDKLGADPNVSTADFLKAVNASRASSDAVGAPPPVSKGAAGPKDVYVPTSGAKSATINGILYTVTDLPITEHFVSFKTSTGAGLIAWKGELTLFDPHQSGLEVTSILGTLGPDTLLHIQFGLDDGGKSMDSTDKSPVYQGRVTFANYALRPNGVFLTLSMVGDTYVTEKVAKTPKLPSIKEGTYHPARAFLMIASRAPWFNTVADLQESFIVEPPTNGGKFTDGSQNLVPYTLTQEDNEDPYQYCTRLAEVSVTDQGLPYHFFTTPKPGGKGMIYHFHGPNFVDVVADSRPTLVYGGEDGGVLDVNLSSGVTYAALQGAVNSERYFVEGGNSPNGNTPGQAKTGTPIIILVNGGTIFGSNGKVTSEPMSATGTAPGVQPGSTLPEAKRLVIPNVKNREQALVQVLRSVYEMRRMWMPMEIRLLGRHDLNVLNVFNFESSRANFLDGTYRILTVDHVFDQSGWTVTYSTYRDSLSVEAPTLVTSTDKSQARKRAMNAAARVAADKKENLNNAATFFKDTALNARADAIDIGKAARDAGEAVIPKPVTVEWSNIGKPKP